ncbi:MAG TPA: ATP-binding protein [Longimicrobium sp.]
MPENLADREFNLQPHPRILPMLGEINLAQWQCLAELIDNSLDAFIGALRSDQAIGEPMITIQLPSRPTRESRVTIRDNALGMDPETLENAARAGWTGNDPIGNLGLFGMGFNIATARLGTLTRVWTTRAGDPEWYGLEIDFDQLMRQRHFRVPMLTRPKPDAQQHGTEISIERLKPEQAQWLSRAANQTKVKRQLERVYAAMLRSDGVPLSLRLHVNGTSLQGRRHCIWGGPDNPQRVSRHARYGDIDAYQHIDVRLPDRAFCNRCWHWLAVDEVQCPYCETTADVVTRERRVHGWLGVQRYYHENEYGIDFLRNGRKIELASRELFNWMTDDSVEPEYPIDDPRHRGRLVGEIHIDHCRVAYTKDRFERNDPAWEEMVRITRGDGPLRPDKAQTLGFGPNDTPLFMLFQAFRRNSPKPKIAGSYKNLLLVPENERSEEMAQRFQAGEAEYQTDAKWWELADEADRNLLIGDAPPTTGGGAGPSTGPGAPSTGGDDLWGDGDVGPTSGGPADTPPEPSIPVRTALPSLTQEYRDDVTEMRWDVRAFTVGARDPDISLDAPWRLVRTNAGTYEFLVYLDDEVFRSATMTALDALLAELSWSAMDFLRGRTPSTFAAVLARLRRRYATASALDPVLLSGDAVTALRSVARSLSRNLDLGDAQVLFEELSPNERTAILRRLASAAGADAGRLITEGRFLEYAPRETLLRFFERHPDLFMDGRYWDIAFSEMDLGDAEVTEEARALVVRRYASLLADAVWLADQDPEDLAEAGRTRLLRAALSLELLGTDLADDTP